MGNSIGGGKKTAKIMKIDGQTFKLKAPATAMDVLKDYPPSYVLLEHESVKRFGIRAPELQPEEELKPGKIYFLLEMPEFPEPRIRRARSVAGRVRVKMRVPRAQIERVMEESRDEAEVAERILELCLKNSANRQAAAD
ncbi:hypothetical protein Salat_2468600 [Sesamum alatum]|uniref:Uncharacterized protein n=1 Tax=Sesamum alatum TaxID=300844 RepID=A0AAE1XRV8_9LAMI|nr:hypothetical protein Salat_2468600 [Sesamum alatum]